MENLNRSITTGEVEKMVKHPPLKKAPCGYIYWFYPPSQNTQLYLDLKYFRPQNDEKPPNSPDKISVTSNIMSS